MALTKEQQAAYNNLTQEQIEKGVYFAASISGDSPTDRYRTYKRAVSRAKFQQKAHRIDQESEQKLILAGNGYHFLL